jgi:ATP-dependent RNA helicase RhlB
VLPADEPVSEVSYSCPIRRINQPGKHKKDYRHRFPEPVSIIKERNHNMTFEEFGFEERIQKAIDEAGFKTPMPVQAQCFQLLIKEHRDIYAQSQTGTGKTAAFLLGIFQLKLTEEKYKEQKALIVVPTRELAVQIENEGKMLGKYLDFKVAAVFGGVGYGSQEKMLQEGVDVLIGTPGRLIDFNKQRKISFRDFGFLVIDEADRLFDMGFLPDLRRIMKGMRPYNERHTMLFSATLNPRVGNLAWEYMNDPGEVIIEPEKVTVDTVTQELYHVGKDEKMKLLLGILKRDDPENAVIFTNTRHNAWEVAKRLEVNGYEVAFLMGDLPQSKRLRIVEDVKKGKHKFLVATDVAARGLHINDLQMVINYDVPLEAESYVHRIGRTARAGQDGKTVTMACEEYVYGLGPIEKLLGRKIPVSWADESFMVDDKSEGMRFPPQDRYRELGGRSDRGGRNDRGGRDDRNNRNDRRPRNNRNNRNNRPGNEKPGNAKAGPEARGPRKGKKALDPRTAKVQSAVSSVAGGGIDDLMPAKEVRNGKKKSSRSGKNENKQHSNQGRKRNTGVRKTSKNNISEMDRVSSDNSIDERLEYYRKKYGEDFQFSGSPSGSGGGRKKREKSSSGKQSGKNPGENNTRRNNRASGNKAPAEKAVEKKAEKAPAKKKKGLINRLFGR